MVGELELEPSDLTIDLCRALRAMEPFGEGNLEPTFVLRGVHFSEVRPVGMDGKHLVISFANRSIPRAVWWNHGMDAEGIRAKSSRAFDVSFSLAISDWGGVESPELRIAAVSSASL